MAEFIFKKTVADAGRKDEFLIESAAVSTEEIGNDMYPPARKKTFGKKCAVFSAFCKADYRRRL